MSLGHLDFHPRVLGVVGNRLGGNRSASRHHCPNFHPDRLRRLDRRQEKEQEEEQVKRKGGRGGACLRCEGGSQGE